MAFTTDPLPSPRPLVPEGFTVDRREALERTALGGLGVAAERAVAAHEDEIGLRGQLPTPDLLREAATEVLRAVLAELVQSGLAVEQVAAVHHRLGAVAHATDVRELLRIVSTAGVDVIVESLRGHAALSRDEEARLRESASRVAAALRGDELLIVPDDRQVLRRLQSTGVDLR